MTTVAKVLTDSIGEHAPRLTALQLRYPNFIHDHVMTHRMLSCNASSSPTTLAHVIQDVLDDPVMPIHWGGCAADSYDDLVGAYFGEFGTWYDLPPNEAWLAARDYAVRIAQAFVEAGYSKQIANRLLEPFCHINVVVSGTEWSNFFARWCRPDARPEEMRVLAEAIRDAMDASVPRLLEFGDWHLPYVLPEERTGPHSVSQDDDGFLALLIKLSVARCAHVQDGRTTDVAEALAFYDNRLMAGGPLNASPAEHQATPFYSNIPSFNKQGGNFGPHWIQFRKTLLGEC